MVGPMRRMLPALLLCLAGCGPYEARFQESPVLGHIPALSRGADRILVVPIHGPLALPGEEGGLGPAREGAVVRAGRDLRRALQDPKVKAVILHVNTPGGGVTASDLLRQEVEAFRKTGRPVVVYAESLNASGGYYVSTAADWIVSNPTTVTGSIGVIAMYFNVEGLLGKVGVEETTFKSGAHKDMTGLFRKISPEEGQIFQGIVNALYDRFVDCVVAGRGKLTRERVKELADGRVYTAAQCLENGLADQVGYLEDAAAKAKSLAGLKGDVRLVSYERVHQGLVIEILNLKDPGQEAARRPALELSVQAGGLLGGRTPGFYYLWMPQP